MYVTISSEAVASNQFVSMCVIPRDPNVSGADIWVRLIVRFTPQDRTMYRVGVGPCSVYAALAACSCQPLERPTESSKYQIVVRKGLAKERHTKSLTHSSTASPLAALVSTSSHSGSGSSVELTREGERVIWQEVRAGRHPGWCFRPFDETWWLLDGCHQIEMNIVLHPHEAAKHQCRYYCDVRDQLTVARRDGSRFGVFREALLRTIVRSEASPAEVSMSFEVAS